MRIVGEDHRWTMVERLAHYRVPGVSVAVIENGELSWTGGFGVREQGSTTPVDEQTVFMGASTSKPVAAFLILQHVERGVLDLDVDINRYLKRWQLPENEFTRRYPVTLRACLSHRAGLTVNGWGVALRGKPVATLIDLLEGTPVSGQRPVRVDKTPGGRERYSGGGFVLAEMLLEDVTGRSFDRGEDVFFPGNRKLHLALQNSADLLVGMMVLRNAGSLGYGEEGHGHALAVNHLHLDALSGLPRRYIFDRVIGHML